MENVSRWIYNVVQGLAESPVPDFSFYLLDNRGELVRALGQGEDAVYAQAASFVPGVAQQLEQNKTIQFVQPASAGEFDILVGVFPLRDANGALLGTLQVQARLDEAKLALDRMRLALTVGFGIAFFLSIGLWIFFVGMTVRPLENLARVSRAVSSGDFGVRLRPPRLHDEMNATTQAFNKMLDTIAEQISKEQKQQERLRQFLAETSHELRSPVTALRGYVDVLLRGVKDDPACLNKSLEAMQTLLGRATRLINDLMLLGQLDINPQVQRQEIELNSLCRKILETAEVMAGGRKLELKASSSCTIAGDTELLSRLLWNLVENAVHYTSPTGTVTLSVAKDGDRCQVTVKDDGEGIHPEHLPRIFDAFYRVNPARGSGAGLGLAIVKSIAQVHDGSVSVESSPGNGSTFAVILPVS